MVTQDTSLLHRSIAANIAYGRPGATPAEIEAAARQAQAHDFILDLVDWKERTGYEAHVGERGVKLSGGQRQRIAIARVILKDAPILILDEATSALDSEVELAIQDQLATLMQGKTVIAIAHRLSTIARMDRLVVLEQGRIVEQGTHDELLRLGGHYALLWKHQSGGFLPAQGLGEGLPGHVRVDEEASSPRADRRRRATRALSQPRSSLPKATPAISASRRPAPSARSRVNVASSERLPGERRRARRRRGLVLLASFVARRIDRLRVGRELHRGAMPALERAEQRQVGGGRVLQVERRGPRPCRLRDRPGLQQRHPAPAARQAG